MSELNEVGLDVIHQQNGEAIAAQNKAEQANSHKWARGLGGVLIGATAVLVPIGVFVYNHDYVATDNCTDFLDKQAVSVLPKMSVAGFSAMMHGEFKPWESGSTTIADVVKEQSDTAHRNYGIDLKEVEKANGLSEADVNTELKPGVYCYSGFGPKTKVVDGVTLIKDAPNTGLWQALDSSNAGGSISFNGILTATAVANGPEMAKEHQWPEVGYYPLSKEFWINMQQSPGITEQALDNIKAQAHDAGIALK